MNRSEQLKDIVNNRQGLKLYMNDSSSVRLNLIYSTLKHRGIIDRANFVNPTNFKKTKVNEIGNIKRILELEQAVKDGKNIGVLVDVDCDGMMSGAILINYFNDNYDNANIHPIFPKAKLHGLKANYQVISEVANDKSLDYVVLPDSSSNDIKSVEDLKNDFKNINVIVIDHHNLSDRVIEEQPDYIINNQAFNNGESVNKQFTGAGMVYESLRYLDYKNHTDFANGYLDLLALGQIGDMSDISNLEIRSLMLRGFDAVNNPLINRFITKNRLKLSPKSLQFSIIPLINAVMRIGTVEEKNILFKALIKDDSGDYQIKKRRNVNHHFVYEDIDVDVYDYVINRMDKIKAEQKKSVKKALKDATFYTDEEDNVNLIRIDNQGAGITGLIANQLLGDTGKPSFVLYDTKKPVFKRGSMRIPMTYTDTLEQLRKRFSALDNLLFAQGHENAAGIGFKLSKELIEPTVDILNDMFTPVENTYEVDDYYINSTPSSLTCRNVDDMEHCFGGKVTEPVVGILGLKCYESNFKINKNTLHINLNGIDFIKFNLTDEEIEFITDRLDDNYTQFIDMVGTLGINRFLGRQKPQFIIEDLKFSTEIEGTNNDDLVF